MEIPEEKGLMVMGNDRVTMRDFLVTLEQSLGIINLACQKSGIGRTTYYVWRNKDEWFKEVADKIIADAQPVIHDLAKHGLIAQISKGNIAAIIFYLKTRHPEFKESKIKGIADETVDKVMDGNLVEIIKAINQALDDQGFVEEWQKGKQLKEKQ